MLTSKGFLIQTTDIAKKQQEEEAFELCDLYTTLALFYAKRRARRGFDFVFAYCPTECKDLFVKDMESRGFKIQRQRLTNYYCISWEDF